MCELAANLLASNFVQITRIVSDGGRLVKIKAITYLVEYS